MKTFVVNVAWCVLVVVGAGERPGVPVPVEVAEAEVEKAEESESEVEVVAEVALGEEVASAVALAVALEEREAASVRACSVVKVERWSRSRSAETMERVTRVSMRCRADPSCYEQAVEVQSPPSSCHTKRTERKTIVPNASQK